MSSWLTRIAKRLASASVGDAAGSTRISEVFYKRSLYPSSAAFLDELLGLFPEGQPLPDEELRVLIDELRGIWGAQKALEEGELDQQLGFWKSLAGRTGSGYAMACYGDALLLSGQSADAISAFIDALEHESALAFEFEEDVEGVVREMGGPQWLSYRLALLSAWLEHPADTEDDRVRELYSELLEEFSGDNLAITRIRKVGKVLDEAVARGAMPRALILRGPQKD